MRARRAVPGARRRLLLASGALIAAPFAGAQHVAPIPRIGYLSPNLSDAPFHHAFMQGMRELDYVEGRNVRIEFRDAAGRAERLGSLAAELIALNLRVLVAASTLAALAAKRATSTLPIVFVAGDPVASGLVDGLARPGGNMTGLSLLAPELIAKRLELLTQAVPGVGRIAVLWEPGSFGDARDKSRLDEAKVAAESLGVRLQFFEVRNAGHLPGTFSEIGAARVGALTVLPSGMFIGQRRVLVDLASKHRLPAVYQSRESVDAGGLMSYGPNFSDLYRRAASYVDKILNGASPGALPVEQPTKFELVVNLRTARALGLTIPPSVLGRADEILG